MAKRIWAMGLDESAVDTVTPRIWIMLDGYDPNINTKLKTRLPGPARWDGQNGRWVFPAHWDTCIGARTIADELGVDLKLTQGLKDWAIVERTRQDTIPSVHSWDLVDLSVVESEAPILWEAIKTRPFQTVGAAFAARNRSCLIADQPGLGKTLQSIAAVVEADVRGPILVVAPKSAAHLVWPQELARWLPGEQIYVIGSNVTASERAELVHSAGSYSYDNVDNERVWVITSPNYVRIRAEVDQYGNYVKDEYGNKRIKPVREGLVDLFEYDWSAVIVDESHQTLAGCTGNKKKQSAQRLGLGALRVKDSGLRIALSGTPFRGKEEYLWGQLNWLRPDLYRSFWRWVDDHFDTHRNGYGMVIGRMTDSAGMYREASSVMIRRTKSEVAKDLPDKQYGGWPLEPGVTNSPVAVWLPMDTKQAKAYADIQRAAGVALEGGTLMVNGVLAELTRLKQFAGSYGKLVDDHFVPTLPSNKFDWLVEFLDERGISGELDAGAPKVVVASQFSQLIDAFSAELANLGIKSHKFTGSTSDKDRERIKSDWQNNSDSDVRVLLLTTTAGGTALTLDAADDMVILDETWSASDQEQLEDRIHRLSRIHQVTIWKVFSRGTIEESIARANLESEVSIKSIIDGSRGIDFVLKLVNPT